MIVRGSFCTSSIERLLREIFLTGEPLAKFTYRVIFPPLEGASLSP
jgi:hypothetical protein